MLHGSGGAVHIATTGSGDALVTISGVVDAATTRRCGVLLRAVVEAGARHVLVDVGAADLADPAFAGLLGQTRPRLVARGGSLLLDGARDRLRVAEPDLGEVFAAYRAAVAPSPVATPVAG